MKRTIGIVLVVLATACGSDKTPEQRPLQYGAPQPATTAEQGATTTATTTLGGSLTFNPTTDPSYGPIGLADELVAALGGSAIAGPSGRSGGTALSTGSRLAAGSAYTALDTTGIDPACVSITPTSATWNHCLVTMTNTDPTTGDTTNMTVTIDGSMSWNSSTGQTTWNIDETMAMTATQSGNTLTMNAVVALDGAITVTASTIVGQTSSDVSVTGRYMGIPLDEALRTTLALDLGYQASPFCITSGSMVLEQIWTQRPMGATPQNLPDQGWRFEWTGCGIYQVAHGS